ncbi:hypothetical protein L218DRAFT_869232, partial [Marasmius fiardii PR-910]
GVYLVLYGISICLTMKRRRENYLINAILITTVFIVASVGLVFNTIAKKCLRESHSNLYHYCQVRFNLYKKQAGSYIICFYSVFTDSILIWRCYLMWNRRLRIILPLTCICITNNVLIFPPEDSELAWLEKWNSILLVSFITGSICTNLLLTLMIGELKAF